MENTGSSSEAGVAPTMFSYASTRHRTESGITINGTFRSLLPNWLVLYHFIKITNTHFNTLIYIPFYQLFIRAKSATEFGTILDILAIRKNIKRNKHQYVISSDLDISKKVYISIKIRGVMGSAWLGVCRFMRVVPLNTKSTWNKLSSGNYTSSIRCIIFTPEI